MCKWSLVITCASLLTIVVGDPEYDNSVGKKTFRHDFQPSYSKHTVGRPYYHTKSNKFDVEIIKLDVIEIPYKGPSQESSQIHHNYRRLAPPTRPPAFYHQGPSYNQGSSYHQGPSYHQGSSYHQGLSYHQGPSYHEEPSHHFGESPHQYFTHKEKVTYRREEQPNYLQHRNKHQALHRNFDIEIIKLDVIELPYKESQVSSQHDPQIQRHYYYAQLPPQPVSLPPYHQGHSHHYIESPYHYEDKLPSPDHKNQYMYHGPPTASYNKPPLSHSKDPPPPPHHRTPVLSPPHQSPPKKVYSNEKRPETMDSMSEDNSYGTTTTEEEFKIDVRSGDE